MIPPEDLRNLTWPFVAGFSLSVSLAWQGLRLTDLKASSIDQIRRRQVCQRCARRLAVVACVTFALSVVLWAASFYKWMRQSKSKVLVRHRENMPKWLSFPDPGTFKRRLKREARVWPKLVLGHGHGNRTKTHHGHTNHTGHGEEGHHKHDHSRLMEELVAYPRVFVGEVVTAVLLSTLFETWEHWIRHRLARQGRISELHILDALFKEVTILGFIGLLLYLVHRFTIADILAAQIFSLDENKEMDENPLFETFELVHMMIFMLLIVLLFQAAALLPISRRIVESWRRYERTKAWGLQENTLESMLVEAKYLRRQKCPESPRGRVLVYHKPFTYGDNWIARFWMRRDPLIRTIIWRALRHQFLFQSEQDGHHHGSSKHRAPRINPALFSFEAYLRGNLQHTILALVEVDMTTWGVTLLALIPLMYSCIFFSISMEFLQCVIAWVLFAAGSFMAICLEEDIISLAPGMPHDARMILKLFSGTSIHDFQRSITPDVEDKGLDLRLGAPGLGGVEGDLPCLDVKKPSDVEPDKVIFSCETYKRVLRIVAFWQAICVTSLVVSLLSHPFTKSSSVRLHILAWAEWPLMLFGVWPILVRKLAMRHSVDEKKDPALIRAVSLHSKECLLRHHVRLVQVMGFFCRAVKAQKAWALPPSLPASTVQSAREGRGREGCTAAFTKVDADKNFKTGLCLFNSFLDDQQEEIFELFQIMDTDNSDTVSVQEFVDKFRAMGFTENAEQAARSVLRLVDHSSPIYAARYAADHGNDCSFTWDKFSSMIALATTHRSPSDMEQDLAIFYKLIDKASPESVTVFEITEWARGIKRSLTEGDVATVLHKHFGEAKPTLTKAELDEWFQALAGREKAEDHSGH